MNHLAHKTRLRNRYYVLRHGKSQANETGTILSNPAEGIAGYGLTEEGKRQVRTSLQKALDAGELDSTTRIVTSDFLRARETAQLAQTLLGSVGMLTSIALRERYFGNWELTSHENYHKVWADDKLNAKHKNHGVESASEVQSRVTKMIDELEQEYQNQKILLVSHGDTLQILQTAFAKTDPSCHRDLQHLTTAEIRELKLSPAIDHTP